MSKPYTYEIERIGRETIIRINAEKIPYIPSIEDSETTMEQTVRILTEVGNATKIVFSQKRDYEYDFSHVLLLQDISKLYSSLLRQKDKFSYKSLNFKGTLADAESKYNIIQDILFNTLRKDPVSAYVKIRRALRKEKIIFDKLIIPEQIKAQQKYLQIIGSLSTELEKTKIISLAKPYLEGFKLGDRSVYRTMFSATIKPDFMYTKLMADFPKDAEEIDTYKVGESDVVIFKLKDSIQFLYHLSPPEFQLDETEYEILDSARTILSEHQPEESDFVNPERMREVFSSVGKDLLEELATYKNLKLDMRKLKMLTSILVRYTVGFGLVEVLLADEKVQDITLNSPVGETPIFIVHQDYDECGTNILPTIPESESWATKLRLLSGRPLDEANPILDTEISIPSIANARVGVISKPLNPTGLGFAFRRHRDKPWTLQLFIKNGMINPLAAGIISFIVDGNRTMLVAGTRSAGKSSFLGSLLVEIMRKYRIITIEDTLELPVDSLRSFNYNIQHMKVASALTKGTTEVPADEGIRTTLRLGDSALIVGEVRSSLRGDQEVVIVNKGLTKRIPIKNLKSMNLKSVLLPTLTKKGKIELKKLSGFVEHPKRKQLIKLTTRLGREVVVTPDHSVFTHVNFKICAIETNKLKKGDPIIIPSKMPNGFNDIDYINLLDVFKENYRLENAEQYIRQAMKIIGWKAASKICLIKDIYRYLLTTQKTRIPIKSFINLMTKAKIKYNIDKLRIKKGTSNSIPAKFILNDNFMRFLGYYLSKGNIFRGKIQITSSKPSMIKDVIEICNKEFDLKVSTRPVKGGGSSVQMFISSKPLADLFLKLNCGKTSFHKRVPELVLGLNKKKINALLKGMFSGGGKITSSERSGNLIGYYSPSKKLVEDVSYLLLSQGIISELFVKKPSKPNSKQIFATVIKQRKYCEYFLKNMDFTHKNSKSYIKSFSHNNADSVVFDPRELEKHLKLPKKYMHLRRTHCCSKDYLKKLTEEVKCSDEIYDFAHGDFFIDKIKSISVLNLNKKESVYDLEVKSTQRFIGGYGGVLLHNTEAKALYEAMRVGALANVVAGTIHGDSPYGVYDRVVNDLEVPKTSFKATDIIIVANPIRSADGMHRWRRITQITEVRKTWEDDPLAENGFVDLMRYDSVTDELKPTPDLMNGDSEIIKAIAGNIKEWAGNWDAVWDNILLRAKIKEHLVLIAEREKDFEILEAEFVIQANDQFHRISDKVKSETNNLDSDRIFFDWKEWLERAIRRRKKK